MHATRNSPTIWITLSPVFHESRSAQRISKWWLRIYIIACVNVVSVVLCASMILCARIHGARQVGGASRVRCPARMSIGSLRCSHACSMCMALAKRVQPPSQCIATQQAVVECNCFYSEHCMSGLSSKAWNPISCTTLQGMCASLHTGNDTWWAFGVHPTVAGIYETLLITAIYMGESWSVWDHTHSGSSIGLHLIRCVLAAPKVLWCCVYMLDIPTPPTHSLQLWVLVCCCALVSINNSPSGLVPCHSHHFTTWIARSPIHYYLHKVWYRFMHQPIRQHNRAVYVWW